MGMQYSILFIILKQDNLCERENKINVVRRDDNGCSRYLPAVTPLGMFKRRRSWNSFRHTDPSRAALKLSSSDSLAVGRVDSRATLREEITVVYKIE